MAIKINVTLDEGGKPVVNVVTSKSYTLNGETGMDESFPVESNSVASIGSLLTQLIEYGVKYRSERIPAELKAKAKFLAGLHEEPGETGDGAAEGEGYDAL